MVITDKEVKRQLRLVNIPELTEMVETYPDDERDGMTEMEVLKHEAQYIWYMFHEGGTSFCDGLEEAREWLKETKNGTVYSLKEVSPSYIKRCQRETEIAKNAIKEYKRLCNLMERLKRL